MISPWILWTFTGRCYGGEEELKLGQFEDKLSLFGSPCPFLHWILCPSAEILDIWTLGCVQHLIHSPLNTERRKMLSENKGTLCLHLAHLLLNGDLVETNWCRIVTYWLPHNLGSYACAAYLKSMGGYT